ncbi:MAG: glutathione peroxidase [Bacteroidia bacterium]|nr:glutathione peroxidase [Bacteroidia bacterium]
MTKQTVYDFKMKSIDGEMIDLSQYKGKVLVIINVASKCGLTPQYKEIEAFYRQYKDKGVVVLGFPANNFLGQEPGTDAEIKTFCSTNYGVSFPMFSKISVKGSDIHPLYQYLTQKSQNGILDAEVTWNFQKFIVNKEGHVVHSFAPKVPVTDAEFIKAITNLL